MSVNFKQPEISVRESINALPQYENLTPEEMGTGTDIGGGETLWGDGSITGGNSNGTYTKWPNGDLECRFLNDISDICDTLHGSFYRNSGDFNPYPHAFAGIEKPKISVIVGYDGIGTFAWGVLNTFSTSTVSFYALSETTGSNVKTGYIAKGTWK